MPSLSVGAKEYGSQRLAYKIDQKIAALAAAEPGLLTRLAGQARQRALCSLGLAELQAELQSIIAHKQDGERRLRQAQRAMLAVVRRVPVEAVVDIPDDAVQKEICQAIAERQAIHEEELLAADRSGQHILQLRRERDQLQDTLWLASSSTDLRRLWANVLHVLGEEPTALQRQVLALAEEGVDASDA